MALELSNYLNDSNYALQAVTQCYGLLAPIIYHNIVLVPVVQVRVCFPQHKGILTKATEQCISVNYKSTRLLTWCGDMCGRGRG